MISGVEIPHRTYELGEYRVTVATEAGPRLLSFSRHGGSSMFACLPDLKLDSGAGDLRLLGGHRLWRAPEVPSVTYEPDEGEMVVSEVGDGFSVTGGKDSDGVVKSITVTQSGGCLVVEHVLTNRGELPVAVAPWAITQFQTGGTAYLPQPQNLDAEDSVLPNRCLVVWPYTTLSEPEFDFAPEMITISASVRQAKTKIGMANRRGWVAYEFEGELFVKWSPIHDDEQTYTDLNASMQCFRNEDFIELESVGPLVNLACGANVRHVEVWALIPLVDVGVSEALASLRADPSALG